MSDPVPAVSAASASGEIADIFADIRRAYRVDNVNLIWRHLATFPGALPWVWETVRPLYVDGAVEREAAALRGSIALRELPAFPAAALAAAGLSEEDLTQIRAVVAAYDRTNAMALIALLAVDCKLAGIPGDPVSTTAPCSRSPAPSARELRLPSLLNLADMSPATAELVVTMNRLGAKRDDAILASMYRHLAHWPAYLALAWTMLAPLDASGRLDHLIMDAIGQGYVCARRVVARLATPRSTLAPAVRADVSSALDQFTNDVIAKMVVIGAILRRATRATSNRE